jgi:hypothetical protein
MRFEYMFFYGVGLLLLTLAIGLTGYGIYFFMEYVPSPEWPTCRAFTGQCDPNFSMTASYYIIFTLAFFSYGLIAIWHAFDLHVRALRRR